MNRRTVALTLALVACGGTDAKPDAAPATKAETKASAAPELGPDAKAAAKPDEPAPTTAAPPPAAEVRSWSFEDDAVDAVAKGFRVVAAGEVVDPPATWAVVEDPEAPSPPHAFGVTKTVGTNKSYNLALVDGTRYGDVELNVMLAARSGSNNQGGGVMFRAKGEADHYIARHNPVENNFRVYALIGGARVDIAAAPLELDPKAWHALRVTMVGDHIECFVDDKLVVAADDKSLPEAGMIGLWTKGDAATVFDDLTVAAIGPR
ncbi:MAG: DUF1080 domain-containing protein [Deltaproteobacteria bacterium]|nr:DUF1080 domain-containing protein [Deltaproteobacteria bacterium]MBK8719140.1 DUF1080 domain-containing protein [Deltaproteobacteria bacterium]MBP7289818.1 DUF1080 domain-containing protein [Nannocystaceae bacterium]